MGVGMERIIGRGFDSFPHFLCEGDDISGIKNIDFVIA